MVHHTRDDEKWPMTQTNDAETTKKVSQNQKFQGASLFDSAPGVVAPFIAFEACRRLIGEEAQLQTEKWMQSLQNHKQANGWAM